MVIWIISSLISRGESRDLDFHDLRLAGCIEGKPVKWIVLGFLLIHLLLEFLGWLIDSEPEAIEQGHYQEQ